MTTTPFGRHALGVSKRIYAAFGQLGACADAWVASSICERRRSRAMPMKTKKPMNPMLEIVEITDDAGLSSPNQPASVPTSRPSHPIHRGSARVVRMATAYSGTTTPKPRKLPAALVTRAMAAKVSAVAANVACPSRVCVEVGRHEFVAHRDRDQMRDSHQRQPDGAENRRQNHHRPSQSKGVVETHQRHDPQKPHQDDQPGPKENNPLAPSTAAIQSRPGRPVSRINTPTPLEPIATAPTTKQITVPSAHTAATVESADHP
jgi:hypothetical protein